MNTKSPLYLVLQSLKVCNNVTRQYASLKRAPARAGRGEFKVKEHPAAAEVLYKNPEAIRNRLRLFHLLRLQKQEQLDRENILSWRSEFGDCQLVKEPIKVTSFFYSAEPGCGKQYSSKNAAIKISASLDGLGLNKEERKALKMMVDKEFFDPFSKMISVSVDYFPFKEQNTQEALMKLADIIVAARKAASDGISLVQRSADPPTLRYNGTKRRKVRLSLNFPPTWIPLKEATTALPKNDQNMVIQNVDSLLGSEDNDNGDLKQ